MERGYIKVWRKLEDSGLLQMPNTLALFIFILMKATHKDKKIGTPIGVIELKRGQYMSGRKALARNLEQSEREIRTSLDRLENLGIMTSKTTNRFSVYTIEKYNEYQDNEQQATSRTTSGRPTDDQQTTTKQELQELKKETISTSLRSVDKQASQLSLLIARDIPENLARDWLKIRKEKKQPLTETGLEATIREGAKVGYSLEQTIIHCCENGWAGFKASYLKNQQAVQSKPQYQSAADKQREQAQRMFGDLTNGRGREIDVSQDGAEWDRPAIPILVDDLR